MKGIASICNTIGVQIPFRFSFVALQAFMHFPKISHITVLLVFLVVAFQASGQEKEYGVWGGLAHSFGDINSTKNSLQFSKPAGGIFFRYNKNDRIAYYFGAAYGSTYGEDAVASDTFRVARNLNFKTNIFEFSTRLEFNFFSLDRTQSNEWFSPFMFIGINAYYFNPKAYYNESWVELQPLGTEGQQFTELTGNDPYHRLQAAIPLGGGVKFALGKNVTVGLEAAWHKLFTDYLDDVSKTYIDPTILASGSNGELAVALADRSAELQDAIPIGINGKQRGDSQHNDSYAFAGFFISYTFINMKCPEPGGRKNR